MEVFTGAEIPEARIFLILVFLDQVQVQSTVVVVSVVLKQTADPRVESLDKEGDYFVGVMYVAAAAHPPLRRRDSYMSISLLCCLMDSSCNMASVM